MFSKDHTSSPPGQSKKKQRGEKKVFWDDVHIFSKENRFYISLDKKPLTLPEAQLLCMDSHPLALAVAEEWRLLGKRGKGASFYPQEIPLTRMAGTLEGRVRPHLQEIVSLLEAYIGTDLLCYQVQEPERIAKQQKELWVPELEWFKQKYGLACPISYSVLPEAFSSDEKAAYSRLLGSLSPEIITVLSLMTPVCGSLIASFSFLNDRLDAQGLYEVVTLVEREQMEIWGYDSEQQDHLNELKKELEDQTRFWNVLNS